MAELTVEQKLELANQKIAELDTIIAGKNETIDALTGQVDDLKLGVRFGAADKLPKEVKADIEARIALGVSPEHALEAAVRQAAHTAKVKAADEAAVKAAKK